MLKSGLILLCITALVGVNGQAQSQQYTIRSIELKADRSDLKVRPLEQMVVRVVARGEMTDRNGKVQEGVVPQNDARIRVADQERGGWISKPFRCEESKRENYLRPQTTLGTLFGIGDNFLSKDCVLYTAPQQPGKYKLEAELKEFRASLELDVNEQAESRRKPEAHSFPQEPRSGEPYRALAEHYAPMLAQETWFDPKADYVTRFDFDGNWRGDDNWENLESGTSQAYVYYAAMETRSHWFLIYNAFHPRDYSDNCVAGTCHENDNEGVIITVFKDGTEFGSLRLMETLAHNNIYSYRADRRVLSGEHNVDGDVVLRDNSHPVVFVESGGHGIYSAGHTGHSAYDPANGTFTGSTGVTFLYKGRAERPRHPSDRDVGYDLLPIETHWWTKAVDPQWKERTFDEFYAYEPFGGRPRTPVAQIPGSFLGRAESSNKAKPFWGWHDNRTRKRQVLNTGQWGLDPAYGASKDVRFPSEEPYSLDYLYNPYLGFTPVQSQAQISRVPANEVESRRRPARDPKAAEPEPVITATPALTESAQPAAQLLPPDALPELPSRWTPAEGDRGSVDIIAKVDGEVQFVIRGDRILYQVISGRPIEGNGSQFSGALPLRPAEVTLEQLEGREKVVAFEKPSAQNDWSVRFRIRDPRGGAARYHVRVSWRRQ